MILACPAIILQPLIFARVNLQGETGDRETGRETGDRPRFMLDVNMI